MVRNSLTSGESRKRVWGRVGGGRGCLRACVGEGWRRESAREEGEEVSEKKKKKKREV